MVGYQEVTITVVIAINLKYHQINKISSLKFIMAN